MPFKHQNGQMMLIPMLHPGGRRSCWSFGPRGSSSPQAAHPWTPTEQKHLDRWELLLYHLKNWTQKCWAILWFEELYENITFHVTSQAAHNWTKPSQSIWFEELVANSTNEFHEENPKLDKSIWVNLFNCRINKFDKIYSSAKNIFFEKLSFQAGTLPTVHLALLRCKFQKNSINLKWKQKNT